VWSAGLWSQVYHITGLTAVTATGGNLADST